MYQNSWFRFQVHRLFSSVFLKVEGPEYAPLDIHISHLHPWMNFDIPGCKMSNWDCYEVPVDLMKNTDFSQL